MLLRSIDAAASTSARSSWSSTPAARTAAPSVPPHWGAEVLERRDNPGFGAASNAGLERARHDVGVLLNPDCELLDGSLGALAALVRAYPRALHVPRLLNGDGSVQRSAHPLPGTVGALAGAALYAPLLPRAAPRPAGAVPGGAVANRGVGGRSVPRGRHGDAAPARPLRPGDAPVRRGHGAVPACSGSGGSDGAAPTAAGPPHGRACGDASRRAVRRPGRAAAGRWSGRSAATAHWRSTMPPRRSRSRRGPRARAARWRRAAAVASAPGLWRERAAGCSSRERRQQRARPSVLVVSAAGVLGGAERVLVDWAGRDRATGAARLPARSRSPTPLATPDLTVVALDERPLQRRGRPGRAALDLAALARDIARLAKTHRPAVVVASGQRPLLAAAAARLAGHASARAAARPAPHARSPRRSARRRPAPTRSSRPRAPSPARPTRTLVGSPARPSSTPA